MTIILLLLLFPAKRLHLLDFPFVLQGHVSLPPDVNRISKFHLYNTAVVSRPYAWHFQENNNRIYDRELIPTIV